ncbi:MAG: phosphotransferase family protein [Rhizobiaceae bacterium]|nr:phosphotransferase family protein [Rhizobiaceae bacterium]
MNSFDPNQLDTKALAPWLEQNIDGFSNLQRVEKFSDGQSNPTYRLFADSGEYVLRAKPPGTLLKSAHQVDREYRVMSELKNTSVPVPKMLTLVDEQESPIGRMFFVMEMLDGTVYWDPALSELGDGPETNPLRTKIYDAMNRALANLHDIDISTTGLGDFGVPGNYFERQLSRWTRQYHASEVERIEDMHRLIAWLEQNQPADEGQISLVHGDYRLDNIMFAKNSATILGILDWELSTLGHPLADLAYQCMQWRLPHQGGFRGLGGINRAALGLPTEQQYVRDYCLRRKIEPIEHWHFYLAFSFFRLAAILQGVYKRSLDGNASNPGKAKLYGAAVPIMAAMAMKMIEEEV